MMIVPGLIIQILFAILFFFLCIAFITGAPFVPSTGTVTKKMVTLAHITKGTVVYDLGSGDGRLLFAAAEKGAAKVVGLEINPYLVLFTNIRIFFSPYRSTVTCRWQNFWTAHLTDADIVFVYLLPWKMDTLKRKLEKELKPGSRVVSNSFIFPGWNIEAEDKITHVYAFTV
jgi:ribosomal protein L11 methylase PrmA